MGCSGYRTPARDISSHVERPVTFKCLTYRVQGEVEGEHLNLALSFVIFKVKLSTGEIISFERDS